MIEGSGLHARGQSLDPLFDRSGEGLVVDVVQLGQPHHPLIDLVLEIGVERPQPVGDDRELDRQIEHVGVLAPQLVLRDLHARVPEGELSPPFLVVEHPARVGHHVDQRAVPDEIVVDHLVVELPHEDQRYNEMIHDDFVGDRSLIDVMAYAGWVLDNQERRREFALWDACVKIAEYQLRSQYTHVFYLPIEFPIVPDGLRPLDPDFQNEIDERMVRLPELHDVNYEPLTGSVEERIERLTAGVKA